MLCSDTRFEWQVVGEDELTSSLARCTAPRQRLPSLVLEKVGMEWTLALVPTESPLIVLVYSTPQLPARLSANDFVALPEGTFALSSSSLGGGAALCGKALEASPRQG